MQRYLSECKGKSILVTGGAGFIGSHIVDRLSPENKVMVLDNLSTGSMSNLEKSKDRITFIKGDILDKTLLKDLVAKVGFVFHLAANVGNIRSIEDPHFDMEYQFSPLELKKMLTSNGLRIIDYASTAFNPYSYFDQMLRILRLAKMKIYCGTRFGYLAQK